MIQYMQTDNSGILGNYRAKRQFNVFEKHRKEYHFRNFENSNVYVVRMYPSSVHDVIVNDGTYTDVKGISYDIKNNILTYGKETVKAIHITKAEYTKLLNERAEKAKNEKKEIELGKLQKVLDSVALPDYTSTFESLVRLTLPKYIGLFKQSVKDKGIIIVDNNNTLIYEKLGSFEYLVNQSPVDRLCNDRLKHAINCYLDTCMTGIGDITSDELNLLNEITLVVKKYEDTKG